MFSKTLRIDEVFFGHTTMAGIPENTTADTKIMNLAAATILLNIELIYCLTLGHGGHLEFHKFSEIPQR